MDIRKILTELIAERDRLDEAILALERLKTAGSRRRGRSPRWKGHAAADSEIPATPSAPH